MLPIVLVIEQGPESLETGCRRLLDNCSKYEVRKWEDTVSERVASKAQLILAHGTNDAQRAVPFFRWLRNNSPKAPVLAVVPQSPSDGLLQSVLEIASDIALAPLREPELRLRMARILGVRPTFQENVRRSIREEACLAQLVGKHPGFLQAVEKVRLFAPTEAPVLITGETGTGKELFAHAIHSLSVRQHGPFIPADCATLPDALAENELFGHRRGAFTDAYADQKGLAGMAEHGTLFLDEIDALSSVTQAKLLRFVQEGSYRALGADKFTPSDVRIIAATNRSLEECVQLNQFRSDLYFRLNVLRLHLPPLRERAGDVALLAKYFAANLCCESRPSARTLSASALQKLENHTWPGNVRELLNVVQRACVYSSSPEIQALHVSLGNEPNYEQRSQLAAGNFRAAKKELVEKFEREYVEQLLLRHDGNVTQAARDAGKERRAFGRMVKKYCLAEHHRPRAGHF